MTGNIMEVEIHPTSPDTMYCTLLKNFHTEFFRSTDQGESWEAKMDGWPGIDSYAQSIFPALHKEGATNDYILFDDNPELGSGDNRDFTIEMRLKCSPYSSDPSIFSNKNWSTGSNKGFIISANPNLDKWQFNMGDGSNRIDLTGGVVGDNLWHHIAVVYDSSGTKKVYQDGLLTDSTTTVLTGDVTTGLDLALGQDGTLGYGAGIQLEVSDIRIWDTTLTAEVIKDWRCMRVDNTHPQFSSLIHYWKVDEGNGTTLNNDVSTNDGTVVNHSDWTVDNEMLCVELNLSSGEEQKRTELAVSDDKPNSVYALATGSVNGGSGLFGVYVSTDMGETWTFNCCGPQPGGPPADTNKNLMGWNKLGLDDGGQYYYDLAFEVSPNNADSVFVAGVNLWISDDGGSDFVCPASWNDPELPGYIHADIHDIHYYKNTKEIWIAGDGGIFYSNDGGATFQRRVFGISGSDFWGFGAGYWEGEVMLGGCYHNGTLLKDNDIYVNGWLCTDGGDGTRGHVSEGRERQVYSDFNIKMLSGDRTVHNATRGFNKKPNASYTIGKTFRLLFHPRYYDTWYTGVDTVLYRTENNGYSFKEVHNFGEDVVASAISFSNPDYLYVTTFPSWYAEKHIYKSEDAGLTWTDITPPSSVISQTRWIPYDIDVDPEDPQKIWIVRTSMYSSNLDGNLVYYSSDGGATWQNKTTSSLNGEAPTRIRIQRGTDGGVYIATRRAVYYRNNTTNDWVLFSNSLPASAACTNLVPYYRKQKLRNATNQSVWEVDFYENSKPIAMPSVDKYQSICVRDTFYFIDHSVVSDQSVTWQWTFEGGTPHTSNIRKPKVIYESPGKYDVTLIVTDDYGTDTVTIQDMIEVGTGCTVDKFPGNALTCNGNPDHVIIPDFNVTTNHFTVTAWVKPDGIQSDYTGIFMNDGSPGGFNFRGGNNTLGYHWPGGAWWWNSGLIVPAGKWSHVAMVVRPTGMTLYVNGVAATHSANLQVLHLTQSRIGSFFGWSGRNFSGQIDEVSIWNKALTTDEIRLNRHLTKNPADDPDLIAYYQLNSNGQQGAIDKTGNFHGKLNGNASMETSSAPIGYGASQELNITSGGPADFDQVGLKIGLPSSGNHPNGEVVVSRLEITPNVNPDSTKVLIPQGYWIMNNYGANDVFSGLDSIVAYDFFMSNEMTQSMDDKYKIYQRDENEFLNNWVLRGDQNISGKPGVNGAIRFKAVSSIVKDGQLSIVRAHFPDDSTAVTISTLSANNSLVVEGGHSIALNLLGENQGLKLPLLTTPDMQALKTPPQGLMVYNMDIDSLCYFDGSGWLKVDSDIEIELNENNPPSSPTLSLGSTPELSAILSLKNNEGGILPSIHSDIELKSITYPMQGMLVYRSDINKICFYNGTQWTPVNALPTSIQVGAGLPTYQHEGVYIGQGQKDPNTVLHVSYPNRAMKLPVQNYKNIPSPAKGLLIYDMDSRSLMLFDGKFWNRMKY